MKRRRLAICAIAFIGVCLGLARRSRAQDAVPVEILQRTKFIKYGSEGGTAFVVDYHGKTYLVNSYGATRLRRGC
jgi:hypothetical protein